MATVTLKGAPIHTNGNLPAIGSQAPDFTLVDGALNDVTLATYQGKKKLLNIFPSLDTPVCAASARRFNDAAKGHGDVVFLMISADLPFAMTRFCKAEATTNVIPLSLMRSRAFARDYGVLIEDGPFAGVTARAVVILDGKDRVIFTQLVPEIGHQPDYDRALAAL